MGVERGSAVPERVRRNRMLVQADVPPLDEDGLLAGAIGTAVFIVASVVGWFVRDWLTVRQLGWWLWVAVTGIGIGLIYVGYCLVRRRRRALGSRGSAGESA